MTKEGEKNREFKKHSKDEVDLIEKSRVLRKIIQNQGVRKIDLRPCLEKAINKYENLIDREAISLKCEQFDFEVQGGSLLDYLFSHIIENSIQHSNCERIRISAEDLGDKVLIKIEDDGRGVPKELWNKAFDRGWSGDYQEGSGLGLYIANLVAEAYGGIVEMKNSELGGTRIDVKLKKS